MKQQTKRLQSLRQLCSQEEGGRSPSYRVHHINWDWDPNWTVPPTVRELEQHARQIFEIEATDLRFPYVGASDILTDLEIRYCVNDSLNDWLRFGWNFQFVNPIHNFPFYRAEFKIVSWPTALLEQSFQMEFWTFTNPRIIQDLSK